MNRKDLVSLLELVKPALSDTNLVPIFTCFAFNQKTVAAYNDILGIVANCNIGNHPFAVNGNTLIGLLQHGHAEEVEFQVGNEDVVVETGRSSFKLPYFNEGEFLFEEPQLEIEGTITIDDDLIKCIEIARTTSSSDSTMPALMGVCFNFPNKALYSCDGDSITRVAPTATKKGKGVFTVPNIFCDALLKISAGTDTFDGQIAFSEGWVRAILKSGFTLYGRLIENDSPLDHQEMIGKTLKGEHEFFPIPMGFTSALSRARVVADAESAKTTLTIAKGKLNFLTQTHMGVVKDELSMRGHPDVETNVHASLVQRSIAICDQIAILENCTAYVGGTNVLQIISNIGE